MRKVLFFLLLISFCRVTAQQNLVPNPSFEEYSSCPVENGELYKVPPWFTPTSGSSDYFNICSMGIWPSNMDVPTNYFGYQYARTGSAYAGLGAIYNAPISNNREYIAVKLIESLKIGYNYYVEFYTSLANTSKIGTDAIGAYLSKDSLVWYYNPFPYIYHSLLNGIPQIKNTIGATLIDTINWMKISGVIKSEGGERFLTIGNFVDHSQSTNDTLSPCTNCTAYYYIDDVSVICLNCDSTAPDNNLFIPDVFSPNGDGNNDKLFVRGNNIQELYFAVYDRWGEKVFETTDKNNGWDGTYKGNQLSGAVFVYYCTGKYTDGKEFKQKGDITLVR